MLVASIYEDLDFIVSFYWLDLAIALGVNRITPLGWVVLSQSWFMSVLVADCEPLSSHTSCYHLKRLTFNINARRLYAHNEHTHMYIHTIPIQLIRRWGLWLIVFSGTHVDGNSQLSRTATANQVLNFVANKIKLLSTTTKEQPSQIQNWRRTTTRAGKSTITLHVHAIRTWERKWDSDVVCAWVFWTNKNVCHCGGETWSASDWLVSAQ